MRVQSIIWNGQFVEKLEVKHGVLTWEVEEVLFGDCRIRRVGRGNVDGEDLYLALGQTLDGRYLSIFFILKKNGNALPISARDMDQKERRLYGRR